MKFKLTQVRFPSEITIQASQDNRGSVLVFKNAILAAEEENKNRDELDAAGIEEITATIAGKPIDIEHRQQEIAGVFTAGRPMQDDLGRVVASVDGMLWASRWPDPVAKVRDRKMELSVEASAERVRCKTCGQEFMAEDDYCACIRGGQGGRQFFGLHAEGGALTENPAGNGTNFGGARFFMMAKWFSPEAESDLDDGDFAWLSNAYKAGKASKTEGRKLPYKKHGKVDAAGWKAAWSRAPQTDLSGGPGLEAVKQKLLRDKPKDIQVESSELPPEETMNLEQALAEIEKLNGLISQRDTEIQTQATKLQAAQDQAKAAQDELKAAKDEAKEQADGLQAKLTQAEQAKAEQDKQVEKLQSSVKDLTGALRREKLGYDDEAWKKDSEAIVGMTEPQFNVLLASVQAANKTGDRRQAGVHIKTGEDGKEPISLS